MPLPGGPWVSRPFYFFWICICSGSMSERKMQSLNAAIRESIPMMKWAKKTSSIDDLMVGVIEFSSGTRWRNTQPIPVEDFTWTDLKADSSTTDKGKAFSKVAEQLNVMLIPERILSPVLVLVTDGQPTDDYRSGLKQIMSLPWGKKAVRIAIGIGEDCDFCVLEEFVGNSEIKPLRARNEESLTRYIKWASTVLIKNVAIAPSLPVDFSKFRYTNILQIPTPSAEPEVW